MSPAINKQNLPRNVGHDAEFSNRLLNTLSCCLPNQAEFRPKYLHINATSRVVFVSNKRRWKIQGGRKLLRARNCRLGRDFAGTEANTGPGFLNFVDLVMQKAERIKGEVSTFTMRGKSERGQSSDAQVTLLTAAARQETPNKKHCRRSSPLHCGPGRLPRV